MMDGVVDLAFPVIIQLWSFTIGWHKCIGGGSRVSTRRLDSTDLRESTMKTVEILQDEHNGVLFVLEQLEQAVAGAERGARVPKDIFGDVQEFFAIFVDQCHHGKEEAELFPRLVGEPAVELVERLEAEHVTGRRLAAAYAEAARVYEPGDTASGARLAVAGRDYTAFLREHIDLETRELLPAAEALADQDEELYEAFERVEEEKIGPGTHERLHRMIEGLPARIEPWLTAGA
jgi:hemerythrin-like domain-containing protein